MRYDLKIKSEDQSEIRVIVNSDLYDSKRGETYPLYFSASVKSKSGNIRVEGKTLTEIITKLAIKFLR